MHTLGDAGGKYTLSVKEGKTKPLTRQRLNPVEDIKLFQQSDKTPTGKRRLEEYYRAYPENKTVTLGAQRSCGASRRTSVTS